MLCTPVLALALGLLLKLDRVKTQGNPPRFAAALFLLAPAAILNLTMFHHEGWYFRGAGWGGEALEDLNSGLALTSLEHIKNTLATDDHAIRDVERLAAERHGAVFVIWEHGLATWRNSPITRLRSPSRCWNIAISAAALHRVVALWLGSRRAPNQPGAAPRVNVPAGARIVWLLNPRTEFYGLVQAAFAPRRTGTVLYTDLPTEHGARALGEYELAW